MAHSQSWEVDAESIRLEYRGPQFFSQGPLHEFLGLPQNIVAVSQKQVSVRSIKLKPMICLVLLIDKSISIGKIRKRTKRTKNNLCCFLRPH